jgi:hypothetical protein
MKVFHEVTPCPTSDVRRGIKEKILEAKSCFSAVNTRWLAVLIYRKSAFQT